MALTKIDDRGLTTPIDLLDSEKIRFGTGNDLEVYTDGSNSYISHNGDGNLRIYSGSAESIRCTEDGSTHLFHNGTEMMYTHSAGIKLNDSKKIYLGTSADLQIYHDGSNSFIDETGTGVLKISGSAGVYINKFAHTETCAAFLHDSAVELYFDGVKKLETHTTGVVVHGNISPDNLYLNDNEKAYFGDGPDLEIYHDGSYNIIQGTTSGQDLYMGVQNEGDEVGLVKSTYAEWLVRGIVGGASSLYFDGVKKLETTSAGGQITGRLNIGTTTEGYSGAEDLTVYKNGDAGITIRSSTTGSATLAFSDGTSGNDEYRGYIQYQHGTNTLALGTNAVNTLSLLDGGDVKILDGDLVIGTAGHGIDFSATSGSGDSERFKDYERGTWTPADGSSDGLTFSLGSASYVKVGDLVFVNFYISFPTTSGTQTNSISGLPFAAKGSTNYSYLTGRVAGLTNGVAVQVNTGASYMHIYVGDSAQTNAQLSGKYILVSGCYSTL